MYLMSLLLGTISWILGGLAIKSKGNRNSHGFAGLSLSACILALFLQFIQIQKLVVKGDYAAIEDTIEGVIFGAVVLIVITLALNIIAFVRRLRV